MCKDSDYLGKISKFAVKFYKLVISLKIFFYLPLQLLGTQQMKTLITGGSQQIHKCLFGL